MNPTWPSGPDGEPLPFSPDELQSFRNEPVPDPTSEQWAELQQRIQTELAQPRLPLAKNVAWYRWRWPTLGVASSLLCGLLFWGFLLQDVPQPEPQNLRIFVARVEPAPAPRLMVPARAEFEPEFPLALAGEVTILRFEPLPGCCEPQLPPPNCPNCPMVYAASR